jgi:hypothetical protein
LSAFSIYGAYIVTPVFFNEWVYGEGFLAEMCSGVSEVANPWTFLFCLSKIPELLDTVFIVLRKRPLRFLQYYHHIVTMWFCWAAWAKKIECGGTIFVVLYNYIASYNQVFQKL